MDVRGPSQALSISFSFLSSSGDLSSSALHQRVLTLVGTMPAVAKDFFLLRQVESDMAMVALSFQTFSRF